MRILLICPTSHQIVTFRKSLIERFQAEGMEVFSIAFDNDDIDTIKSIGIEHFSVSGANRSLNLFKTFKLKNSYVKIIKQIQPDIVFTFMMKPNIFGVRAAKKAGVKKIFAMVEGAGDVFINNGIKWKLIRAVVCKMYRKSFRYSNKVFFLNNDDKAEFIARKLVKEEQCEVIPGIGVDLEHFAYKPLKNHNTFLMIARMLKTKGVMEYCQAARLVKQKYPDAVFNYLGGEGTLKIEDIQEYIDDGSINYLGTTEDVRPYLEDCTALILPSFYREGLPMSIMEAEAIGRCIITTDNIGCRETVKNGYNGFLLPCKDVNAIVGKCCYVIEHFEETAQMGENSRRFAQERFEQNKINELVIKNMD